MCGILGVVGDTSALHPGALERARDVMLHRGPDQGGLWESPEARLGFRRLAILDLSPAGHQPMVSADGQVVLVFNGEIWNFGELRRELEERIPFRSRTDSEVLLNGYQVWGWQELLRRIDGMFAFVIWDTRTRTLHGARDRVGKKPLFYCHTGRALAFASTLNALGALLPDHRAIDAEAVDAYLTYQAVPAPMTVFERFRQLPPAHHFTFRADTGALEIARYWDVGYGSKLKADEAHILDELDALLRAAVRRRLISDVPLGAFLSGGVDSSLVVALMAQETGGQVEAVTMGFDDPAFDERPHARRVAERWGVRLHEHVLRADAVADLPEIIWHYGQPLADVSIVPTYYVARAAKEHVTVVLNGDGGDELFGGYARPVLARAAQHYRRLLPAGLRRAVGHGARRVAAQGRGPLRNLLMLAEAGARGAAEAFVYDRAFRPHRELAYAPAFYGTVRDRHPDALYRAAWTRADATDDVDRALYGDLTTYLPDQLLAKMDVSTMAHSVEARSPLLDKAVMEYAARIPTALRLSGYRTKHLLKRLAGRYVPHEVIYRRKQGFVMPAGAWLRGELAPFARAALTSRAFADRGWVDPAFALRMLGEHEAGARDWGQQLWTLFVLEVWARMALDGTMSRRDRLDALL